MSKKTGKLDLLVRVRYSNPLPPPPYPPKLLTIPTDISRLGEPSYLNHLTATTPLPMLVDAEMGMPLDLNQYDGVWEGRYESMNPRPDAGRMTHPADLALLAPLNVKRAAPTGQAGSTVRDVKIKDEDLATLRTSNAKQKRALGRLKSLPDVKPDEQAVDASETAQIMAIDGTFLDMTTTHLDTFRHPDPKKKDLRVVDSYEILPDEETWGNMYFVIKYPERPSSAFGANSGAAPSSLRLRKALLHPDHDVDGADILDYFLAEEEDAQRVDSLFENPLLPEQEEVFDAIEDEVDEVEKGLPNVHYERIRSYEIASGQHDISKEYLLTIVEGAADEEVGAGEGPANKKRKGGYLTPIASKLLLRKTRAKRKGDEEAREDMWDRLRLGARHPHDDEVETMAAKAAPIVDQNWTNEQQRKMQGGDNQIVGEGEAIDEEDAAGDAEVA